MTRIYFIRHCESMGNVKRIFQGSTDLDASPLGEKQLEFLSKRFENITLNKVYSSPLKRTVKTAHAIADGKNVEICLNNELRELHGGVVEGKLFKETFANNPDLADIWNNHPEDFAPENGEKMRDAYERIWSATKNIISENKEKTIAIASHGGILRCLFARLIKGSIDELKNIPWLDNTGVSLVDFDDDFKPFVHFYNDHSHIPDEYISSKTRLTDIAGK